MSSLTDSRNRHGAKACVDAVRADYPHFNRVLLSQCEAPERYGVQLVPEAAALIKALDAPGVSPERNGDEAPLRSGTAAWVKEIPRPAPTGRGKEPEPGSEQKKYKESIPWEINICKR